MRLRYVENMIILFRILFFYSVNSHATISQKMSLFNHNLVQEIDLVLYLEFLFLLVSDLDFDAAIFDNQRVLKNDLFHIKVMMRTCLA